MSRERILLLRWSGKKDSLRPQDALIAIEEYGGDILLTEGFKSYVNFRGFKFYLCRTRNTESKEEGGTRCAIRERELRPRLTLY